MVHSADLLCTGQAMDLRIGTLLVRRVQCCDLTTLRWSEKSVNGDSPSHPNDRKRLQCFLDGHKMLVIGRGLFSGLLLLLLLICPAMLSSRLDLVYRLTASLSRPISMGWLAGAFHCREKGGPLVATKS